MENIEQIKASPVYQQVLSDSFGGVMYNVANRDKYDTSEIMTLWDAVPAANRESVGGIMKGAFNFLKGDN